MRVDQRHSHGPVWDRSAGHGGRHRGGGAEVSCSGCDVCRQWGQKIKQQTQNTSVSHISLRSQQCAQICVNAIIEQPLSNNIFSVSHVFSCWTQRMIYTRVRSGIQIALRCWQPSKSTAIPPSTWASSETSECFSFILTIAKTVLCLFLVLRHGLKSSMKQHSQQISW